MAIRVEDLDGFGTGIGVHFPIGYTSFTHLLPVFIGATMFVTGMTLTYRKMVSWDASC